MDFDEIRARLQPEQEDEEGIQTPEFPSHWRELTDDELFVLVRKAGREWHDKARVESELTMRLIRALSALRKSNDDAASRLYWLTWALVVLTIVIAVFTIAVFLKS